MDFNRTGIILYTINYQKCVKFYQDILELNVLFKTNTLTCFEFGSAYLMVEIKDENPLESCENRRTRMCLRMNVTNVKAYVNTLENHHIEVDCQEHEWGTVAKFLDPDGNLCAFKDTDKFERQVLDWKSSIKKTKGYERSKNRNPKKSSNRIEQNLKKKKS